MCALVRAILLDVLEHISGRNGIEEVVIGLTAGGDHTAADQ
jgi:hypothetical protein